MTPWSRLALHRLTIGLRLALAALVLGVFAPHLGGDFVWDDLAYVFNDPRMSRDDRLWDLLRQPLTLGGSVYRPVSTFTIWLEIRAFGMSLAPLRALNLLLHLGVVQLVYGALTRAALPAWTAAFGAALFAVHPGVTETVMFIVARHDAMGALLALGALFAWTSSRPLTQRALVGATLYALALGCKESLVVLPPLVAVTQAYAEQGPRRARVRAAALQLALSAAVTAAFFAWRAHLHILSGSSVLSGGPRGFALALTSVVAHYAGLALRLQQAATALSWKPLGGLAALGVVVALAVLALALWRWSRKDPTHAARVAFGASWFLAFALPNALVIPVTGQFANRYLYIPLVGFVFAAASVAHAVLQNRPQAVQRACALGGALLVLVGALVSAAQASRWRTGLALFGADLVDHPDDARVVYHYAVSVVRTRGCPVALPLFVRAAELDPGYARAWHNVAGCLLNLGRYGDAVRPAERAWRLEPDDPSKLLNLGVALVAAGDHARGRHLLARACQALPREPGCALLR